MVRSYLLFLIYTLSHIANAEFHNYLEHFHIKNLTFPDPLLRHDDDDDRPTLTANTTKLTSNEQWVTFSIDNVQDPSEDDIIAIFTPPDAYKDGTAPVKYEYIAPNNINYLSQGSASVSLRLINMRNDIRAVFIRHGPTSPSITTLYNNNDLIIRNKAYDNPHAIHLLIGGSPSEIKVQWTTRSPGDNPLVRYGTRSGRLEYVSPATTTTYTRDDMCGGVAAEEGWIDPGMFHTASMTGLQTNTRYYYQVGDSSLGREEDDDDDGGSGRGGGGGSWSAEMSFVSHPGVGPDVSVSFLAVADQGVGEPDGSIAAQEYQPAIRVAQRLAEEVERGSPWYNDDDNDREPQPYTMILHNGDISYARGYSALWDTFLLQQQAVATRVPYATCPGNHEMDWPDMYMYQECVDSFGECGVPYSTRFPMPIAGGGSRSGSGGSSSGEEGRPSPNKQWYSFDYGPIHFTVISTEHDFTEGSAQHHWMNADLKSVDRSVTPWLVMATHRPVYVDSTDYKTYDGKQTTAIQLQTALEHLLHHHRVDVVLSGHHHSYQRTCPVKKGKCRYTKKHGRPDATVYIVHGNGGAKFYDDGMDPKPEWADAVFMTTYGHLRIHADRRKFHVQAVDVDDGEMFDEVVLEKKGHEGGGKVQKFSSSYDDDSDSDSDDKEMMREGGEDLVVAVMTGVGKGAERGQRLGVGVL